MKNNKTIIEVSGSLFDEGEPVVITEYLPGNKVHVEIDGHFFDYTYGYKQKERDMILALSELNKQSVRLDGIFYNGNFYATSLTIGTSKRPYTEFVVMCEQYGVEHAPELVMNASYNLKTLKAELDSLSYIRVGYKAGIVIHSMKDATKRQTIKIMREEDDAKTETEN